MAREKVKRKTSIGGQAVMEGVMMRGPERTAMAVRHVDGSIRTDEWETAGKSRAKIWKLPFIRGIINFVESLVFGYRCLMKSMEMSGMEEELVKKEDAEKAKDEAVDEAEDNAADSITDSEEDSSAKNEAEKEKSDEEGGIISKAGMNILMVVSAVLGIALSLLLFMYLPIQLRKLLSGPLPFLEGRIWRAVFEGLIRIVLFLAYMVAVSFMKDIRRVFMYHGAEHKTIFCFEKGIELTVENVRKQTRFHPRCGTSFMFLMMLIGIIVSIFIPANGTIARTGLKLLTMPIVISIGYEIIKLAGRSDNILVRMISAPGLWVQRITTKEPTDDMIEVAITSFKMVVPEDEAKAEV